MNWYIVQAYSGFEKKVVESIKEELKKIIYQKIFKKYLFQHTKLLKLKKGKRTKKKKNFFQDTY